MTLASLFPLNLLSPSGEGNVASVLPTLTLGRIQTVTKTMGRMQVVYQDGGEDVDSVPGRMQTLSQNRGEDVDSVPGPWGGFRLCPPHTP